MHEVRGHCERAMVMYWEDFLEEPHLGNQLSRSALLRIAKGLNETLLAERGAGGPQKIRCPPASDFIAWGRTEAANTAK